ncbi:MAG: hypothetical protein JW791_05340 [Nanoarchaeota archaeon]|nr:hypothetical protein [Nanoarchaeota archaeon]
MIKTGLRNSSLIIAFLGFFLLILIPLYLIFYLFYIYYKIVAMPFFLIFMPLVALSLYLLYVAIFIIEAKIAENILNHKIKEGLFKFDKITPATFQFSFNDIMNRMIESLLDKLLIPKGMIAEFLFNLFGLKRGKGIMFSTPLNDPYLTEIGDNVIIGKNALVLAHFIVNDTVYLKKTKIGNNVTIGTNSIISPGVTIEDNVIVGAGSFVKQDSVLKKNSLYAGSPAILKKKLSIKR